MKHVKIEDTPLRILILHFAKRAWVRRGSEELVPFNVPASHLSDHEDAGSGAGVIGASSITWPGVNQSLPAVHIQCGREAFWALENGSLFARVRDPADDLGR